MIEGMIGENNELLFELILTTPSGLELPVDALLDTGFSEWLVMDRQDVAELDWTYVGTRTMQMVIGEVELDVYLGRVYLAQELFEIPVYAGQGIPEILMGRQWLRTQKLVVDLPSAILTLGESMVN